MGTFRAAHRWGGVGNNETWYSYNLPKEDPKSK